ncbi:hypothetical protein [Caballeronia sp. AZ7_KS35]|uniref:hypothetical protein n=1 Tax=Caballeronia sp. AZ7_KS35 TaxID=2921762 RepID=UPI0020285EB6|nr:hypothetical protein [Caballeronia sp. AZ7_KS35]
MFVKLKGGLLNLDDVHEIRPSVSKEFNSYVIFKASAPRRAGFLIDTVEEIQEAIRAETRALAMK